MRIGLLQYSKQDQFNMNHIGIMLKKSCPKTFDHANIFQRIYEGINSFDWKNPWLEKA